MARERAVSVVEVTVRWRPARAPGEFGELPPWTERCVREESGMPEGEGLAWDLVSELVRTAPGPMILRVIDNQHGVHLSASGGSAVTFMTSKMKTHVMVARAVPRLPGVDPDAARVLLYAMAEVGRKALARPRGGGETQGKTEHMTDLFAAMQAWCASQIDDATLDAKARRARNRARHAPRAVVVARTFADVCARRTARDTGGDALAAWRATLFDALGAAAGFSSERLVRGVFSDHMAESMAATEAAYRAAGFVDVGEP